MIFGRRDMQNLFSGGHNTMEIAAACRCTEAEVYNHLHRCRNVASEAPKRPPPFWTDDKVYELTRLAGLGVTVQQAATLFDVSKPAIHSVCQKHKIKFRRTA